MSESRQALEPHPAGDAPSTARELTREAVKVDTFGGTVHVEWDPDAAATPLGHLAFFAEYLKVSGRFDALAADCPLHYTSPNAPSKRDILGTTMLSILAGQWRYAHITALRGDGVNPSLLGMTKVASEDSVRRALERIPADEGASRLVALALGLSLELDAIGVVDDAVEHRVRDRWLADYLWPALHGDLTGDEDGLASVALLDNLQQVAPALGGEALQPPVVEDQQGDPAQAAHQTIERAFVARGHG